MKDERTTGLMTITITQFALVFMLSAVAVAVPALGLEFGASASQLGLVESGYISAVAMLLFPVTRLSDKIGRGTTFAVGVAWFTMISLLIPICQTITQFIILRVFQGAGGAMMVSTGLAILADLYPGPGRAKAMGIASAGVYLGLSAGPWLGGMIVTHWGWRWIFYAGALPCLLGLILSLKTLPVKPVITRGIRFDWGGAILCALGMIMLSQGGSHLNDTSGKVMLIVGLLSLAAFVLWEKRTKEPLLDMTLFEGNPSFSLGSAVQFISYAATFGVTFLISLYLQIAQGMTASEAGIILMAQPVMQVLFSLISGNWCERWPAYIIATLGMVLATLGLGVAIFLGTEGSLPLILIILGLCGAGSAIFATANMAVIMGAVSRENYGVASAVVAGMRTTGMTVSLVFISAVFAIIIGPASLHKGDGEIYVTAMNAAFISLTVFSAFGVIMSARARKKHSTVREEYSG
ncbi:MFS transporter [Pseudodesulfovibrio piezophilus]|uniref:Putative Drug resistance transporter n=1 Tax=Pseudodesulfovibrio piezophilus (strain DSM 21447 / JCM 15486 / C1TLV30) TaxID=1322246 RepID=M1WPC7_PSEP2|nr:MFS transporter [Pseudodesulfovibrio piezophilus]CCH48249.1 putative Drug resistance transporter [Pseudodesulfovibrio piezophilus C1TLV30]